MLSDSISDRTIVLLLLFVLCNRYESTKLMCRLICNLPELSIRIFNPVTSYFLIKRYEYRIKNPDIQCCRIKYPTEHQLCCFETKIGVCITTRHLDFSLLSFHFRKTFFIACSACSSLSYTSPHFNDCKIKEISGRFLHKK